MSKKITIEDLYRFKFIQNLSFNPSKTAYAYEVVHIDKEKDSYFSVIYVNKKKYENKKAAHILGWYADDKLIISEENTSKTLLNKYYLLNIRDNKKKTLFTTPLAISKLETVSDNLLVFTATIDANEPDLYKADKDKIEKYQKQQKENADYEVLDEIPYWYNGAGFINKKRTALFTATLKPFKITRISDPYFATGTFKIRNNAIYYTGKAYTSKMSLYENIYRYDLNSGKNECLYDKDDMMISDLSFCGDDLCVYASNGKKYGINETSKFHLLQNKKLIPLESPDRSLYGSVAIDTVLGGGKNNAADENYLYTLATETDHVELWRFDKERRYKKLFSFPMITFFDLGKDRIIFCGEDEAHLCELYEYSFKTKKISQLSGFNNAALKDRYIAIPKELTYQSEGEELNGWVLLPKDYDQNKKYPAVLDIHGGPRTIYSTAFFHEMQVWASQGYFVMFTNIHGSDGRGDEFADIQGEYGTIDFKNLMDFTDAVLAAYPQIDEKRLCETGGSYGGFMTNWIIGHTDRFCCTASQRSISNWQSFTYLSDIGFWFGGDQNGTKDPFKDHKKLWEHSPLKYADKAKTPTLFIHSDQDYRCPLPEGMQMMQALAANGVDTRLVLFHGENHELSRSGKPKHRIRRLQEITAWFNKYCDVK